tara:strand:+ start:302 stop:739 length:438 start_codon:yes stop_codon:yes gene_type:complete
MLNKIKIDLSNAMKSGDKNKIQALRNMISALKDYEINNSKKLTDDETINVLSKQAKKIKESIAQYKAGDRDDLVQNEEAELYILNSYLPEPTSPEKIIETIEKIINELDSASMSDFGMVMGKTMASLPKNTDGKIVQGYVKDKLR